LIAGKRAFAGYQIRGWLIALGVLLTPGLTRGQTVEVPNLSLDGARAVLHAAEQKALQLAAPSSLAVVNPAGDLILFEQLQDARPIGIELAMGKARSAALFQLPTQALEAAINTGRPAAITAKQIQMQGGVPIRVGGAVVGAVGVSGLDKDNDLAIAEAAAAAVK
jgi:glc operon protein GlcG